MELMNNGRNETNEKKKKREGISMSSSLNTYPGKTPEQMILLLDLPNQQQHCQYIGYNEHIEDILPTTTLGDHSSHQRTHSSSYEMKNTLKSNLRGEGDKYTNRTSAINNGRHSGQSIILQGTVLSQFSTYGGRDQCIWTIHQESGQ